MDMKAKSSLIRKYRTDRLWSQEQLAEISGLGLRTIQRLEARGSGSQESIKALAAVFEVEADTLFWRDGAFQSYKHKQWGLVTLVLMPVIAATILIINESFSLPSAGIGVLFGVLTLAAITFSSMTIEVNESEINWYFGPGLFKKSLPLEEVGQCKKVKNPLWMGIGIHAFGTGWIYNVSGLLGVEIELKGGSFIRLGTDEPNYLVQAIEDAKNNVE
ncbi:MAG: helix-turn-helix transcriptional regulator [Cellvibrio sp.]|uniref:helix-turn-helix transcriptional regulator n=1 Tax=Cellvibrio sp. TaxID=1965322 RepID=UPI0031AADF66